ncbi:MAG: type II toxin-antitoxin system VapB family antitoxin [Verrucomicrobiae bacterium]|nr:type II toxin-antitoxin system VapB family antitoxin [Verrucomicrobiae bacterium]MCP5542143.1 type II toxin-antitoxin system VapB family antitoxin [Akkermansiaceae bacterium]
MKMTMHIDEDLLDEVIREYGFASKTEAVERSLREMCRRSRLRRFLSEGLGLTPEEMIASTDPNYDPQTLRVAEPSPPYGSSDSR